MNVAVLMTCHNRREVTLRCLSSLYDAVGRLESSAEGGQWKFYVFIVDDGSTDGTGEAVKKMFERSNVLHGRVIKGNGDLFWAKGMALVWYEAFKYEGQVRSSTSTFNFDSFLWLNDDTILRAEALTSLSRLWDVNNNAVIVGSLSDETTGLKTCGVKEGGLFTGNFVLIPRSVYEKVGMICGRFYHAWADSDYAMRCMRAGVQVVELDGVGVTRAHDLRPMLRGVSLLGRIRLLFDPKGWCVHDLVLYRIRNWGVCAAIASALHLIIHVLKGGRA